MRCEPLNLVWGDKQVCRAMESMDGPDPHCLFIDLDGRHIKELAAILGTHRTGGSAIANASQRLLFLPGIPQMDFETALFQESFVPLILRNAGETYLGALSDLWGTTQSAGTAEQRAAVFGDTWKLYDSDSFRRIHVHEALLTFTLDSPESLAQGQRVCRLSRIKALDAEIALSHDRRRLITQQQSKHI
jgi:hypothetical protein